MFNKNKKQNEIRPAKKSSNDKQDEKGKASNQSKDSKKEKSDMQSEGGNPN